jgi:hypothetical protein
MEVLIVEPMKEPYRAEIKDDLRSMQEIVGGSIEAVYPWEDPVTLVCNEEGKLEGLPLNRSLGDYDVISGTFFICGVGGANFESLPPDLLEKYRRLFYHAETFFNIGGIFKSIKSLPQKVSAREQHRG